jgi:hypothetical protein
MLPNREGLFNAYPANIGVGETGPNNLATCVIEFQLYEELRNGDWTDCSTESLSITGYFYIEKRDGALNQITIDALKAALGWDGIDLFWLQDTNLSEHPVQVRLGFEEYQGKNRIKVQFLNPYGSSPSGVTKADEATRRSITNRLGARLRATAGGTPAPAPPPSGRPKPPASRPALPPKPKKTPEQAMDEAWAEFTNHCKADWTDEQVEDEWFRILGELFPGKKAEDLTPDEWDRMREEGPGQICPF